MVSYVAGMGDGTIDCGCWEFQWAHGWILREGGVGDGGVAPQRREEVDVCVVVGFVSEGVTRMRHGGVRETFIVEMEGEGIVGGVATRSFG